MRIAVIDLLCEERPSDSPLVQLVWRSTSESAVPFISMAGTHSSIVVTRFQGRALVTVRGPETGATPAVTLPGAETFGIVFRPGVFFADWPAQTTVDRGDVHLPEASGRAFWLKGAAWPVPDFDNAEPFVRRLARDGLLVYEPLVSDMLRGHRVRDVSLRTVQRRFLGAAGMTQSTLWKIERARHALHLLQDGASLLDATFAAGYYDQPHLTRSLKALIGLTPTQITDPARTLALSFSYKTLPLLLADNERIRLPDRSLGA
jgi:AraC-like DNA-binding protein